MEQQESPRLVLVILAVSVLERSTTFYENAFGWRRTVDAPVYVEYELAGGMRLGLYQRESFAVNTGVVPPPLRPGGVAGTELYLYVDDLAASAARLNRAGARLLSEAAARDWGETVAYFADPDGNVIAVAEPSF